MAGKLMFTFEMLIPILALCNMIIGFFSVIILSRSNMNFTKGEVQKITSNFAWGTMLMFGGLFSQFLVEYFGLGKTPVDLLQHALVLVAMVFYMFSAFQIYNMSKELGFASDDLPKKLKRILKR
jgi:hypothetical protein